MDIIKNYAAGKEKLYDIDLGISESDANKWRKIIKTCKFECWSCNFCDKKANAKLNSKATQVANLIVTSVTSDFKTDVPGLSSERIDKLLNELGKISTSYLEVGCLGGRTFSSTIAGNSLQAYAVDKWEDPIVSENEILEFHVSKKDFIRNITPYKGDNSIKVFNCDYKNVNTDQINNVDLFLYDGDHSYESTKHAVTYFANSLADEAVLVFDDANWKGVVEGALDGIDAAGLELVYDKKMLNSVEDSTMWWNGLLIAVVKKK